MAARSDDVTGYIRGIAIAQMVIAVLFGIFALFSIEHGLHVWLTPVSASQPQDPRGAFHYIGSGFEMVYFALLLTWLGSYGRAMVRSLRPVGVSLFAWFALKLVSGSIFAVFLIPALAGLTFQYKDHAVRLGDAIGGLLTAFTVGFVLVTICMVALFLFYRSRAVQQALDRSDGARYWTDQVPLPLLFGAWMFVSLALDTFGDLYQLRLETWFGTLSGLPSVIIQLLTLGLLAGLAWGFCRCRPWAWYLALAASPFWFLSHYLTNFKADDPELLKIKDYAPSVDLMGFINHLVPILDTLSWVQFGLFLVYLVAVRRLFRPMPPPSPPEQIKVMADRSVYWGLSKRFTGGILLGVVMLMLRQYFMAFAMLLPLIYIWLFGLVALRVPALAFGLDAVTLRLQSLLIPPRYAYTSLREVRVLATWPKDTRSYDPMEQRLNLSAQLFTPEGLEQLKTCFQAHGIAVMVEKSA